MTIKEVIHKAIKSYAGLGDCDDEAIADEVNAIVSALKKAGFSLAAKYTYSNVDRVNREMKP